MKNFGIEGNKRRKISHISKKFKSLLKPYLGLFLETPPIILKSQIKLISITSKNPFEGSPEKEHVR